VRDLFVKAKEAAPSIIFIDELDAIGRSRQGHVSVTGANDEREQTLDQILTKLEHRYCPPDVGERVEALGELGGDVADALGVSGAHARGLIA
jgi:hypothetical protein